MFTKISSFLNDKNYLINLYFKVILYDTRKFKHKKHNTEIILYYLNYWFIIKL